MANIIASQKTADDKTLYLWSDGDLTWGLGRAIKGVRLPRKGDLTLGFLVLGELSVYDASEVPQLVKAAQKGGLPGEVRARFGRQESGAKRRSAEKKARLGLVPKWTTLEADRGGHPTLRVWKLPKLVYGGLAVWHERGVYEVMREASRGSGTFAPTGFKAKTLSAIIQILPDLREKALGSGEDVALKARVNALVGR
jgi:hypothetical protein